MNFIKIFITMVTSAMIVLANDASFIGDGATVYTTKESRVRMAKENIIITYDDSGKNRLRWKADCTFEFENLSTEKISFTMGFPNWKGFGDGIDHADYVISNFTTHINDKPVTPALKDISKKNQIGPWIPKGRKAKSLATFDGAYVWPVDIEPKGRLVVKNTFSFGGFSSNGPFDVLEHMPPTYPKIKKKFPFWRARSVGKNDIDFSDALVGAVAYITTTGQTWSGPIGEATISFDIPEKLQKTPHFLIPLPQGYHLQKNKITWHFKNYLPKEEIVLYFLSHVVIPEDVQKEPTLGFQYADQAQAWVHFASKSRIDPEVIDQLVTITQNPDAKKILNKAKDKLASTKIQTP
ncbi:MAG: hypothetical protein HUU56_03025 [Bdellovibrionaceae bacterium]|nr:hypothetical protein [Pseudobdellovibrionaceae bacterium]